MRRPTNVSNEWNIVRTMSKLDREKSSVFDEQINEQKKPRVVPTKIGPTDPTSQWIRKSISLGDWQNLAFYRKIKVSALTAERHYVYFSHWQLREYLAKSNEFCNTLRRQMKCTINVEAQSNNTNQSGIWLFILKKKWTTNWNLKKNASERQAWGVSSIHMTATLEENTNSILCAATRDSIVCSYG